MMTKIKAEKKAEKTKWHSKLKHNNIQIHGYFQRTLFRALASRSFPFCLMPFNIV